MPSFFYHIGVHLIAPTYQAKPYLDSRERIFVNHTTSRDLRSTPHTKRITPLTTELVVNQDKHQRAGVTSSIAYPPEDTASHDTTHDWRSGPITLQSIDMLPPTNEDNDNPTRSTPSSKLHINDGIGGGPSGLAVSGRFEPTEPEEEDLGWGVIRLYRDTEETPGLHEEVAHGKSSRHGRGAGSARYGSAGGDPPTFKDEDCTTLCILAVPSYLTPSDFLGVVGAKTREDVSHFRMIRTEKINRYMFS